MRAVETDARDCLCAQLKLSCTFCMYGIITSVVHTSQAYRRSTTYRSDNLSVTAVRPSSPALQEIVTIARHDVHLWPASHTTLLRRWINVATTSCARWRQVVSELNSYRGACVIRCVTPPPNCKTWCPSLTRRAHDVVATHVATTSCARWGQVASELSSYRGACVIRWTLSLCAPSWGACPPLDQSCSPWCLGSRTAPQSPFCFSFSALSAACAVYTRWWTQARSGLSPRPV